MSRPRSMNHLFKYAFIGLLCMGFTFSTKEATVSLDQLPTSELFKPRQPVGPDRFPEQQADLVLQVANQVEALGGVHIVAQRMFIFTGVRPEMAPQWVVLHAELGNQLIDEFHANEISRLTRETGPAAISIWRLPHGAMIAIAQSRDLPDGNALVGYFALEQ